VVRIGDNDVSRRPPWWRSRAGLGRSFQRVRVVEDATARENVQAGLFRRLRGREAHAAVTEALERVAVSEFADWAVQYLSYGTRRKIELARVVVGGPQIILLDEPTAGVSSAHVMAIEALLRDEAARSSAAVVVVDHDLEFIRRVASRVVVLDAGRQIFEGTPRAAFDDDRVIEAYIGR
jgi:branched-chain amino acid transport system ATP-binding protein